MRSHKETGISGWHRHDLRHTGATRMGEMISQHVIESALSHVTKGEAMMADPTPLERLFTKLWDAFSDGYGLDGAELQSLLEVSGLTEWRKATENNVAHSNVDIEVGHQLLTLTDEGKRIVKAVHAGK